MAANTFFVTAANNGMRVPLRGDMAVALNGDVDNTFSIRFFTESKALFTFTTNKAVVDLSGNVVQSMQLGGDIGRSYELMFDSLHNQWKITDRDIVKFVPRKLTNRLPWEDGGTVIVPPAPTPTITLATNTTNVTISSQIVLTATVTDTNTITRVEFYKGATLLVADTTSPYTANVSVTSDDNGTLVFSAILYDSANNVITSTTKSVVVNIAVTPPVDSEPPAIVISASKTSSTVTEAITITAVTSDNVGVTKVEFYKNAVKVATVTAAPFQLSSYLTNADNGTVTYTAIAYDTVNYTTSNAVNVTVNIAAPAPITDLTMSQDIIDAANTARDGAVLGSKRLAVAQAIVTALQPSHILNVYRNAVLISAVTFTGDCTINNDGVNVTVGLGLIATTNTNQNADINTGTWTFTVAGGSSSTSTIQGTIGPVGSNANITIAASPSTTQPFDVDISFLIPRTLDGFSS